MSVAAISANPTADQLAVQIRTLIDEAGGNDGQETRRQMLDDVIRTEMRRLNGDDVGPVPRGGRARKGWALTPEAFARALNRITTQALGARASGLPIGTIVNALRNEISR